MRDFVDEDETETDDQRDRERGPSHRRRKAREAEGERLAVESHEHEFGFDTHQGATHEPDPDAEHEDEMRPAFQHRGPEALSKVVDEVEEIADRHVEQAEEHADEEPRVRVRLVYRHQPLVERRAVETEHALPEILGDELGAEYLAISESEQQRESTGPETDRTDRADAVAFEALQQKVATDEIDQPVANVREHEPEHQRQRQEQHERGVDLGIQRPAHGSNQRLERSHRVRVVLDDRWFAVSDSGISTPIRRDFSLRRSTGSTGATRFGGFAVGNAAITVVGGAF